MKKRWLVSLLVCILTICLLSVTAFAAEETAVAEVGGVRYSTLQAAINAAQSGDTVKLLEDVTGPVNSNLWLKEGVTLDLDSHTLTAGYQIAVGSNNATATVKNGKLVGGTTYTVYAIGNGKLTLEDVTVTATDGSCAVAQANGAGVLTLKNCSVDGGEGGGIWDFGTKSTVNLTDSVVTGGYFGVYHNGSTAGFTLTAEKSTIIGDSDTACAIYISGNSANTAADRDGMNSVTLTGCTVTGPTGVEGKYTNMVLDGCDITATAEQSSFEQYNNGSTALGFAVVSTDNSMSPASPTPSATITINGGTYEGLVGLSNLISTEEYANFKEADITVTGGTFSGNVSGYLAEDADGVEYHDVLKAPDCKEGTNGIGKLIQVVDGKTSTSYYVIPYAHKAAEAVKEGEKAATCTEAGSYEAVVGCSVCGQELSRETVTIEAKGHTEPVDGVTTVEATCVKDGSKTYTCAACSVAVTEVLPATGEHTWVEGGYVEPTCTENGKAGGQVCSVCGAENPENPPEDLGNVDPAKGHTWVLDEEAEGYKAATCVEDGVGTYVCSACEATKTEVIPATGEHTEKPVDAQEATCGKAGYTEGVQCSVCKQPLLGMEEIPATGVHTEETVAGVAATCKATGLTGGKECSVCGEPLVAQEVIPVDPNAHVYDVTELKEADCTTNGVGKYVCELCGDTKYAATPAAHSWDEGTETKEATCTDPGEMTYTCTKCGETKTEETPANGHSWNNGEVTKEANCGEDGVRTYTCTAEGCDATKEETIPANGEHNFQEGAVDATCTEPAMAGYICTVCGQAKGELTPVGDPAGHKYEKNVTLEATCAQDGKCTYTCAACGDTYDETIPATGKHVDKLVDAKDPTCVEDGYTEGVRCETCDKVLYGCETIPATGVHTEETVAGVPATCKDTGLTEGKKCSVCKADLVAQEVIPVDPNAHTYKLEDTLKEATCTTTGIGKYVCSDCGAHYYATIEASHNWGEPVVTMAATCGKAGEKTFTCSECEATKVEAIPATGDHHYEETVTPATCTANAKITFTCEGCDAEDPERDPVEVPDSMIAHDYEETRTPATCTADGSVTRTCKACGAEETTVLPALGHTPGASEYTEATCTENGKDVVKCTVCSEVLEEHDLGDLAPAKGHTEVEIPAVAATCASEGKTSGVQCAVCEEILVAPETIPVDSNAHVYVCSALKEATCTATGIGKYTCSSCGDAYYGIIEMKAHEFDEDNASVKADATCTEAGVLTVKCKNCDATEERAIEALGHSWGEEKASEDGTYVYKECARCHETEIVAWVECQHENTEVQNAKDATCTEAGYTGDTVCTKCGDTVKAGEVIEATGHTRGASAYIEPTCTENGKEVVKCTVCGEIVEEYDVGDVDPAKGHTWGEEIVDEENARVYHECQVCHEIEVIRTLDPDTCTHENREEVVVTPATCTEDGTKNVVCTDCNTVLEADVVIPMTGHTPAEAVKENEIPATETEDGSYDSVVYCSACGEEISRETVVIPATGPADCEHAHTERQGVKEATCTEDGYTGDTVCTDCGETVQTGETISATGHNLQMTAGIDENGRAYVLYTCSVCGYTERYSDEG